VEIAVWLRNLGLERYEPVFRDNAIDADVLPELTDEHLKELGLPLGHRLKLLKAVAVLRQGPALPAAVVPSAEPPGARNTAQAERRQLTVMFADLVGSTALSAALDPEEMRDVIRAYQNTVAGEITRFEGHVAKYLGDGVLAYFGWPQAHEDDSERAVQAGLTVVEAVGRLSPPTGDALAARVGIATGLVVVGDIVGEGAAREEMVVGDTPNLAARLQEAATPGAVVISDGTRRLLGELFELRELGATKLKGFAMPVSSFQVLSEHPMSSRFEARRTGQSLPMVGRDQELALVLERWRQAVAGEGQAVLLVGEAGIGKSRLIHAILDAVAQGDHFVLRYQCSPHHTGTALWPVIQKLGLAAGFEPADTEAVKLDKLEVLLRRGARDISQAVPLVAALLGIDPGQRYPAHGFTPHQQRARTLSVLVEQLLGLAHQRPVLMVVEDAHWIDPTTLELIGQAIDQIAGPRVLMLLTSRPDNQPSLGGHPHVTRLTLNRLGRGPIEAIIAQLVGRTNIPRNTLGEIAARTDGVPLFVEELTKAVMEAETVGTRVVVPVSLYASLMARLDRVPEVKEAAQVAACIGREFSYSLLSKVWLSSEAELLAALDRLAAAELIFRRGTPPEANYAFKHALVRDATHESLLKAQRQKLHARIVQVLEECFPETVRTEPELLAQHCSEAGLSERAIDYWYQAGQQAVARSAMKEAVAQLSAGLDTLRRLPEGTKRDRRELDLQTTLGVALLAARGQGASETGRTYARARDLAERLGETQQQLRAVYGLSAHHNTRGDFRAGGEAAETLLRLAKAQGDETGQAAGYRILGATATIVGQFVDGRAYLEAVLAGPSARDGWQAASLYAMDPWVVASGWLAWPLLLSGHPEQAWDRHRESLTRARELAHPNTLAQVLFIGCTFCQLCSDPGGVLERAEELSALATEQGFPLWRGAAMTLEGWALAREGRTEQGIEKIGQGIAAYCATEAELWRPLFLGLSAEAHALEGRQAEARQLLTEAVDRAERTGERWFEAELHRLEGAVMIRGGTPDPVAAEGHLQKAVDLARSQRAKWWELRATTNLARRWRDQGRWAEAHGLLTPVCNWFTEGFDTPDLREARALLSALTSCIRPA
jgi:class 3 adenylate cyclase/predicted ATPase